MTAINHYYGRTVASVGLRMWGDNVATPKQAVYDGDTIHIRAVDEQGKMDAFAIRFLGIDTPEKRIPLPTAPYTFVSLDDPGWDALLSHPFQPDGPLDPAEYTAGLRDHILQCARVGQAANHKAHADTAEDELESLITADIDAMNATNDSFRFYLSFAFEIMDRYGRFLCYINRNQPDPNIPAPRPPSLNERLLMSGIAFPYFIWPNINPWRSQGSKAQAVLQPNTANDVADGDSVLNAARQAVRSAREHEEGVFNPSNGLTFEPFEVRYLGRGGAPSRWVIDLGKNDDVMIHPQNYWTIVNPEDRLFIPEEYVPLFISKGWQQQPAP